MDDLSLDPNCPYARPLLAVAAALGTVATVAGLVALTVMTALI
jgi:hypothetical protein